MSQHNSIKSRPSTYTKLLSQLHDVRLHGACLLAALILSLAPAAYVAFTTNHCELEMQLIMSEKSWLHIYPDNGSGFVKDNYRSSGYLTPGKPVTVRFPLGPRRLHAFRLHISNINGEARFSNIRIINSGLAEPVPVSPALFRADTNEQLVPSRDALLVTPRKGSNEASVSAAFDPPIIIPASNYMTLQAVMLAYLKSVLLLYCAALFIGLGIHTFVPAAGISNKRVARGALAAAIFTVVLSSRLWLVGCYGSSLPFWDQWVVEINQLYLPYFDGSFADIDFWGSINGHHLLISRLSMFGLFLLNGSFSNHLQMFCSALMISCIATCFYLAATRLLKGASGLLLGLFIAILFSMPFDWENALWGLTGPQLLLLLSIAAFWCVTNYPPRSKGWYTGVLLGFCAILEMASGLLVVSAPAVVVILYLWHRGKGEKLPKSQLALLCVWATVGLVLYLQIPSSHFAAELKAPSVSIFLLALSRFLAWPLPFLPFWTLCQWMPFLLLLYRNLSRKRDPQTGVDSGFITFIIATGLWVLLQAAAIAYGRGATAPSPSSRYTDILAIGVLVNATCLLLLLKDQLLSKAVRVFVFMTACCWLSGVIAGLSLATVYDLSISIPQKKMTSLAQQDNVEKYLSTGDRATLIGKPVLDVPYEVPESLFIALDNRNIGRVLPELTHQNKKHQIQ